MYQLTQTSAVIRVEDGAVIPADTSNYDYQQYQTWRSLGNTPIPYTAPSSIPDVSPRQIRQAMTRINLRTQVESAVASGSQDLKDWWGFSTVFERNNPQVQIMATTLGQTSQQLDSLWALAKTL